MAFGGNEHFGGLEPFTEGGDWQSYSERLDLWMVLHGTLIETEEQKVAALLTKIGAGTYELLRNLVAPALPKDKKYDELKAALKDHLLPKPLVIAERFRFHRRNQKEGETVARYIAELRKLAENCEFNAFLEEALRDRLVCGMSSEAVQRKLLAEDKLTLKKAVDTALAGELSGNQAKELQQAATREKESGIHRIWKTTESRPSNSRNRTGKPEGKTHPEVAKRGECYRCLSTEHFASACKYQEYRCSNCQKVGHLKRACRTPGKPAAVKKAGEYGNKKNNSFKHTNIKAVRESEEEFPIFNMFRGDSAKLGHPPLIVEVLINEVPVSMEVDTGATVTIMSTQSAEKIPLDKLQPSEIKLKAWPGHNLDLVGQVQVKVEYKEEMVTLPLLIVKGNGPPLLGRNWLTHLRKDWTNILNVQEVNSSKMENAKVNEILREHAEVFKDELGCLKGVQVSLPLEVGTTPKFCKARTVPYALRDKISDSIDELVKSGVLESVRSSNWATPTVNILKPNGEIRICGDYKVTVNQSLSIDQYPLPKAEDLFSTLNGGQKFTKLDLRHAYEQLEVREQDRDVLTINTHKGLFRYTRIPYGIASAPAILQKQMEILLSGIQGVCVRLDDVLITGSNDKTHEERLQEVLKRIQKAGLRIRLDKCEFMVDSVTFLGHKVSASGIGTTAEKVQAVQNAPIPKTKTELRAFLGLVNYYGKFMPNLSTVLNALNNLLRDDEPWEWTEDCDNAMMKVKKLLTSAPVLAHYDGTLPIRLECDASPVGVGAVLSHVFDDGTARPIAYASRTLSHAEKNYAQIEREALGIVFGITKFHDYLYGRKFILVTDNRPLVTILGPKTGLPQMAAVRMQRWALRLAAYTYDIQFRTSKENANADALSRLPVDAEESSGEVDWSSRINQIKLQAMPVSVPELKDELKKDRICSKVLQYTLKGWPQETEAEMEPFKQRQYELTVEDDCLLWGGRVIVPEKYQQRILEELHTAHDGMCRMKALARMHCWWPEMDRQIERHVGECGICRSHRNNPPRAIGQTWEWPNAPWSRLHLDFAGPFMGSMFLVVVDAMSKWMEVQIVESTAAETTIEALRQIFATHGLPERIVSDNGPPFHSVRFKEFVNMNGIRHTYAAPYHPSTNGEAERAVQTLKQGLRKTEGTTLKQKLCRFLLQHRITPQTTTGHSPSQLLMNRVIRSRLDVMRPSLQGRMEKKKQEYLLNKGKRARQMEEGQKILVRDYRKGKERWIKGEILERMGEMHYRVKVGDLKWTRHIDQLLNDMSTPVKDQLPHDIPVDLPTHGTKPSSEEVIWATPNIRPGSKVVSTKITSSFADPQIIREATPKGMQPEYRVMTPMTPTRCQAIPGSSSASGRGAETGNKIMENPVVTSVQKLGTPVKRNPVRDRKPPRRLDL